MHLALLDWVILIGFLGLILAVGLSYTRKAGKDINSFFLGGRDLPWVVAGLSMVATTFAADTPLAVADLVGTSGISGNWLWWNFLIGGMLTAFFFARLWRRANVLTEVELIELRYGGKPAAVLRGIKAVYLGIFFNVLIIGWVSNAMIAIFHGFLGVDHQTAVALTLGLMALTAVYSSLAGLQGIAVTDVIQFGVALGGCIILAVIMVRSDAVGGIESMKAALPEGTLDFFPRVERGDSSNLGTTLSIGIGAFFARFAVQWWASWYPGAEPGGGGYVAQRMMSTRSERDSLFATLLFQVANICLRPWPWIVVGLCALQLYALTPNLEGSELGAEMAALEARGADPAWFGQEEDDLQKSADQNEVLSGLLPDILAFNRDLEIAAAEDPELGKSLTYHGNRQMGYVFAMRDFLPVGLAGLLLAAFLAAFMSTISTQLNWGASYLVNDLYLRFFDPEASARRQVLVARLATLLLMGLSLIVASTFDAVTDVWTFLIECGAGLGLVLILRWYWWRINAWSELAATIGSMVWFGVALASDMPFPNSFFFIVVATTVTWLLATFITPPESPEVLSKFYRRVRPEGAWEPVRRQLGMSGKSSTLPKLGLAWILAVAFTYGILFLTGTLILAEYDRALGWLIATLVALVLLVLVIRRYDLFASDPLDLES